MQYLQRADGSIEPQKIHTVVISTQQAVPVKAAHCKEVAGYKEATQTSCASVSPLRCQTHACVDHVRRESRIASHRVL